MCSQPALAPGWALLDPAGDPIVAELAALGIGDAEDQVRIGAFAAIEVSDLYAWIERSDVDFDRAELFERLVGIAADGSERVRSAVINFAVRAGGEEGRGFLASLRERGPSPGAAFEGLVRLEAVNDPEAAFRLAVQADQELSEQVGESLGGQAGEVPLEALAALAGAPAEGVRILAAELLGERGEEAAPALRLLLDDPEDAVLIAALDALVGLPEAAEELRGAAERIGERGRFDAEIRRRLARLRSVDELRGELDWTIFGTAGEYQVLAEEHLGEFGDQLRRDLGDDFVEFAREGRESFLEALEPKSRAALEALLDREDPEDDHQDGSEKAPDWRTIRDHLKGGKWNLRSFSIAALRGLGVAGECADADLVREHLDAADSDVREAAAVALARVGAPEDVPRLLELARGPGGEPFAAAAIALSPGPGGAAKELLGAGPAVALLAARHLYSRAADLDEEALDGLLRHESDGVRRVGVACVLARTDADPAALEKTLASYTSGETYYYNVVCELDRLLFAPPELKVETARALAAYAATQEPRDGARRNTLLNRLIRSRQPRGG
jgi:HEAT repeat protein